MLPTRRWFNITSAISISEPVTLLVRFDVSGQGAPRIVKAVGKFPYQFTIMRLEILHDFRDEEISRIFIDLRACDERTAVCLGAPAAGMVPQAVGGNQQFDLAAFS